MRSKPGTYALILRNRSRARLQVGRRRHVELERGYYIYIGSAFGPGGVRARVSRHIRGAKSCHWHIDYVSRLLSPIAVWYSYEAERLEHRWAQALRGKSAMSAVRGFGCSDCRCYSHFFHTFARPELRRFATMIGGHIDGALVEDMDLERETKRATGKRPP